MRGPVRASPDERRPARAYPLFLGATIGAIAGCTEVLVQLGRPGAAIGREHLCEAAVLYGATGLIIGAAVLGLFALFRRRPSRAFSAAVLCAAFVFLMLGGYVNLYYLPGAVSRTSLLFTALILLGGAVLGVALYAILRGLGRQGLVWRAGSARARHALAWSALGALIALGLVSYLPQRQRAAVTHTGVGGADLNVLLIVMDALRPDHLSAYGYSRETSPNIDRLAAQSALFADASAQSPWTKPATASLLTGLYPSQHRVNLMASGVPPSIPLITEILQSNGYRTGLFTANSFITPVFGFGRGVDRFYASRPPRVLQLMLGHLLSRLMEWSEVAKRVLGLLTSIEQALVGGGAPQGGLAAEGLTHALLAWIDESPGARFFAYVHYMEPHAPYVPPAPYDTHFLPARLQQMPRVSGFPPYQGFLPFERGPAISPDSLENMIAQYDGEILYLDHWLGRLFDELRQRGLFEKTLIVLTADHGEEFYDHGGWGHGQSLFQELLRVPLIVSAPRLLGDTGQRWPHAVRQIDLPPTILDYCGILPARPLPGLSLRPILDGVEAATPARMVYSEVDHGGRFAWALREGPAKVIFAQQGRERRRLLFDLASDPFERTDLAAVEPLRAQQAQERLADLHDQIAGGAVEGVTVTIDDATRERLRGLGYVQ